MTDLSLCSDEELLSLMRSDSKEAGDELVTRYKALVKKCSRPFFLVGGDSEDLIQEGMIGLLSSMQNYDESKDCSFRTYAELCIKRRIISAIKAANRNKHQPLNSGLSLEEISDDTQPFIADERLNQTPEQLFIRQEERANLYILSRKLLSSFERDVLVLYLEGLSYDEMAKICGKPVKSIDTALQRIKKKLAYAASENKI